MSVKHQLQQFMASNIVMLELLHSACVETKNELNERELQAKIRFETTSQKFIEQLKKSDDNFDYTKFVRKAFSVLKVPQHCEYLLNMDSALFTLRDNENKIMTILPGLDLKVAYNFLSDEKVKQFWQYMHLFANTVFHLIKDANEEAFSIKYTHITNAMTTIEQNITKTGILFNNQIFNPFIGVGTNVDNLDYNIESMFVNGELPKQQNISIDSMLSMLGVKNMLNEEKLKEELKNFSEDNAKEASDKILDLLGATGNSEIKDVCNILIADIVSNFKTNGLDNFGETLMKVAENAKTNIDAKKMKKTAEQMHHFMANSQDKLKNMKDADGNPIGEQLMKMSGPLSMLNLFNKQ